MHVRAFLCGVVTWGVGWCVLWGMAGSGGGGGERGKGRAAGEERNGKGRDQEQGQQRLASVVLQFG